MNSPDLPRLAEKNAAPLVPSAESWFRDAFREPGGDYLRVIAHLRAHGATPDDAKDAAQNAFKHALQLMSQPEKWARVQNPPGWIRGVAVKMWLTPPGPRRRPTVPIECAAELPDANADPGESVSVKVSVMAVLDRLEPDVREVVVLKMQRFSLDEIVSQLNAQGRDVSESTVRNLLRKGRDALRPLLEEMVGRREAG